MKRYDVLVYGPIFCDIIFTGVPGMPSLGKELFADHLTLSLGGSAIVASGLNRLGMKVGLISDLGDDSFSRILWEQLEELRLDRSLIRKIPEPLKQVTVALSFPEDRAFVTRFQHPKTPIDLEAILRENKTKHLHICSFLAALDNPDVTRVAHAAKATVSADFGWDKTALLDPKLDQILSDLDIFLPSKSELCHMVQIADIHDAAKAMMSKMGSGCLVVKDGVNGAFGYTFDKQINVPAISVNPVETTGAGDAFDAGFIYAYLRGETLETCMKYGVICGGLTTTFPGGIKGFPTIEEVKSWL
jgi:hypothetical protein